MPEKEILYHEPVQVHPFHHPSASTGVPTSSAYPNLQLPSAFVAFQTNPMATTHVPTTGVTNHLNHHAHLHQRQMQQQPQQTQPQQLPNHRHPSNLQSSHQLDHNQLPHLHHHSAQSLQSHETSAAAAARYLWDPSAVAAANFHHPSAHG